MTVDISTFSEEDKRAFTERYVIVMIMDLVDHGLLSEREAELAVRLYLKNSRKDSDNLIT